MKNDTYKFSILIPTWNNYPFLKCCIESIEKNSYFSHQLIVHVNEGNDETLAYLQQQNISYTYSVENIGICKALNTAAGLVKTDYIVYMNDDMYVLPHWDKHLWEAIQDIGHEQFYLSATLLEPKTTGNAAVIAPANYGTDIATFNEQKLIAEFEQFPFEDWSGASWPPSLVHTSLWQKVGGYSESFSPGFYSDPDFSMKLWQEGVRYFRGVSAARVYHFQSKSLHRVVKNDGRKQFYEKWGITASFFDKKYIKKGEAFSGLLRKPAIWLLAMNQLKVKMYKMKDKLRK